MPITKEQLLQILPNARSTAGIFVPALNRSMARYDIGSPVRQAAFLAQVGHESGSLHYVRELGGDAYLSKYDTGKLAQRLGNTPEADGDGQKYRGRGLIQITGSHNYKLCGQALGLPLLENPELLEQPEFAALSAAWFWWDRGLNELADAGLFDRITRVINGGTNGQDERRALWAKAKEVLCLSST